MMQKGNGNKMEKEIKQVLNLIYSLNIYEDEISTFFEALEDHWWMNYKSIIPSYNVTNEILESVQELKAGKGILDHLVRK